jgi:glycosyltransferase involved in cell wall biosynthesis
MAVLEGMAAGRPVVTSDRVGAAEVIPPGGGAVVPGEDPEALAGALAPYLEDRARADAAGAAARDGVHAACAPDVVAAQQEGCYERAIARRRAGRR